MASVLAVTFWLLCALNLSLSVYTIYYPYIVGDYLY